MNSTPLIVIAGTDPVTNVVRAVAGTTANQLSQITQPEGLIVAGPGQWSIQDVGLSGAAATITKPAGGAGVRHVAQALVVCSASTQSFAQYIYLRDGPSGVGTVLVVLFHSFAASASSGEITTFSGLNIFGSPNTAMTLEFIGGATGVSQTVSLTGFSTTS